MSCLCGPRSSRSTATERLSDSPPSRRSIARGRTRRARCSRRTRTVPRGLPTQVHFDLLVPDTPEHRALSWKVPQLLATADFGRTGLLAASPALVQRTAPGDVQVIEKVIYDQIPDALKVAMGLAPGPAPGPTVPVLSDGKATVLTIGTRAPVSAGIVDYAFTVPFDQVITRPFCSQGPADFLRAQGSPSILRSTVKRGSKRTTASWAS